MLATALRQALPNYTISTLKHDVLAAFVVTLVALPLSMALSIAVGLPPQHGLYTAIIAGIVAPLFGGSTTQVSGPTAAFVVILAPIVAQYGLRGIIWCSIIAGFILIGLGISKLGKLINYIPYPVTTGFTAGIAVVLGFLSLNDFMGLGLTLPTEGFISKASLILTHLYHTNLITFGVGILTLVLLITSGNIVRFIPSPIIAIAAATLLTLYLNNHGYHIATIETKFHYITHEGLTVAGIPPYPPHFSFPTFNGDTLYNLPSLLEFKTLLFPAFTIAILAALESLLSATVADSMTGTRHDPNAEVTAIGIANIACALFGGIPATGAIARTATAINSGARTPIACILHAIFILISVMLLSPYIKHIPMTALAAILIYTAYRMSHWRQFVHTLNIASRSDRIVLLTCFALTVFIDMVAGVGVGLLCASLLLIKEITELTSIHLEFGENEGKEQISEAEQKCTIPSDTLVYHIHGPLFFGTIEKAFDSNRLSHEHIHHLIIDMRGVPFIDMTGLVAINSVISSIAKKNCRVTILSTTPTVIANINRSITNAAHRDFVHFHENLEDALS